MAINPSLQVVQIGDIFVSDPHVENGEVEVFVFTVVEVGPIVDEDRSITVQIQNHEGRFAEYEGVQVLYSALCKQPQPRLKGKDAMLKEISKITGIPLDENDHECLALFRRIERKLPVEVNVDVMNRHFRQCVIAATLKVQEEGPVAPEEPKQTGPRPLKIKSSPKGVRIKVAAANGVRFSYGPIWNASVQKGKGIAVAESNRVKLEHQATILGIEGPLPPDSRELAALVAARL